MLRSLLTCCASLVMLLPVQTATAQQVAIPPLVRLIVPFTPGAGTDVMARAVAAQLGQRLGISVIVENRAGASGTIGVTAVVKGPRDGSMLLFTSASLVTTAATMPNVPFDITTDLTPVAIVSDGPMLVGISAKSGITTPAELVAAARAKPDSLTAGSGGTGSVGHMASVLLNDAAKIQMRHIPYRGAAPALLDVAAGNVDMLIASYSTLAPQIKSGRVLPIAVTSLQPSPAYPGIPAMASAAPGYDATIWYGVLAPAGIPASVLQRLHHEITEIAKSPELRELQKMDGAGPVMATPEELSRRIRASYAIWKQLAKDKNIVAE